ncbi:reticulon-like protein B14 isoform X3 [Carica papaya]|uniref:reticulon-like protein B14 isoform X3 n=1 Tax=Carica papaya TaxID=3649 RepID=UPI000B8CC77E|nr:reticulon-like protein B14 isoform X3 [Carica papaya]
MACTEEYLHEFLGGGYVADICLWRNQNISLSMLIGSTVIWFLLEVVECYFIPLVCYVLILMMIMLFLWSNGAGIFNSMKGPPGFDEIKLSESTCEQLLASGFSVMSSCFSSLTFIYIVFLCFGTLPIVYMRYKGAVNYFLSKSNEEIENCFQMVKSNILDKIPRVKEKSI